MEFVEVTEEKERGRGKMELGEVVRDYRFGFYWNKVIFRYYKGRNKTFYKWGFGD